MRRLATVVVFAGLLLAPAVRAQTETTRQHIGRKMVEVRNLYYEDQMPTALDVLGEIKGLLETLPDAKPNERAGVQLWRAAVYVALGDQTRARAEATAALSYDPTLVVDLAVFPPSVKTLVDSIRTAGSIAAPTPVAIGAPIRPTATPRNPAVAPSSRAATPLVRRPVFWGAVGGVVLAAAIAGAAASAGGSKAPPGETDTTITVGR